MLQYSEDQTMNIQKLIAIIAAILINFAVLAWFHAWTSSVAVGAGTLPGPEQKILTLPAIDVHPSAEQLRALKREQAAKVPEQANAAGDLSALTMPYYSFAAAPGNRDAG
jgi:hypothetical protein